LLHAVGMAALIGAPSSGLCEEPLRLDLRAAITLARKGNPTAEAARRRVDEARGGLSGARVPFLENPELELGLGPRFRPSPETGSILEVDATLSQRLEIAGQRSHRIARARAEVAASEGDAEAVLRTLDLAVATAYFQALAGSERLAIAQENLGLAQDLAQIATRRFEMGAATPLDVNGARIRVAEANRTLQRIRAERDVALARLHPLVGAPAGSAVEVDGELPRPGEPTSFDLEVALRNRPEARAAQNRLEAAEAADRLASAQAVPDLRIGARYALEEGSRVVLGLITVPLPLFQRNQGERERSRAAVARARAEERATRADVLGDARQAALELERARRTLTVYDEGVLRSQSDNVVLLRRMFEAGKVSPAEVILLQRELLEGRLGYVDARAELATADARLRTALGLSILDAATGGSR
jgi:cobalt-zinc-cadmium efflux system outer membrane protein